jgi:hypothetical protein
MAKDLKFENLYVGEAGGIHAIAAAQAPEYKAEIGRELSQTYGTITRVVGDDLIYVLTDTQSPFVFTPDKIHGYKGQHLKEIGIREGLKVSVTTDRSGRTMLFTELPESK